MTVQSSGYEFDALPEEDNEAFIEYALNKLSTVVEYDVDGDPVLITVDRLRLILQRARRLFDLSQVIGEEIESWRDITDYDEARNFLFDVRALAELYHLKKARERSNHVFESVEISKEYKGEIRDLVNKIKERVEQAGLDVIRRESLQKKLNAFLRELDFDRTRLAALTAAFVQVSGSVGEAAEKLEPVVGLFERIMKAIGMGSKELPGLPRPEEQRRLAPPENTDEEESNA